MAQQTETERVRHIFDASAAQYDKGMAFTEKLLFGDGRAWACSQARGRVLEVAIGTGLNLPFYPSDIELTGIEISPAMMELARRRAQSLGLEVKLVVGDAQALPFSDQRFDTVICTIALCSIPDERKAISEVWRVLRSGGRFVALEHVRSPNIIIRGLERMLESYTVRTQADHLLREPVETVQAVGFSIEYLKRQKLGIVERLIARKDAQYMQSIRWKADNDESIVVHCQGSFVHRQIASLCQLQVSVTNQSISPFGPAKKLSLFISCFTL